MQDSARAHLSPASRPLSKIWGIAAVLALVGCTLPLQARVQPPRPQKHEGRHQIDDLEDAWRDAVLTSNSTAMASLLADDYTAITASGTLQNKDEALAGMHANGRHITSLTISERKVRFYGQTAVVTSLADLEGTNADGSDVTGSYRYTRVYVRDPEGNWKIVSFEASRIREPGPRHKADLHP
jgi:ketosteroid isomerase-like protein